jgi:hypothetical protein
MEGLGIIAILVGVLWWMGSARKARERRLREAKTAYEQSLNGLKRDPTNADLKQQTLALGRAYSNLTRDQKGVTTYDEVALSNDISAACAAAGGRPTNQSSVSAEVRLSRLADLHKQGLVSDEEYQSQRRRILSDL